MHVAQLVELVGFGLRARHALRVGPHKREAPIQRIALIIMARGKKPRRKSTKEKNKPMRERTLPEWESALPGTRSCRKKHLPGKTPKGSNSGEKRSASGGSQNGSPLRSARLKMKEQSNANKTKQARALNSTTVTKHLSQ
ncbi:hypothetical protein NDU88_010723 [Pleurodeles waltl]|uniref:Uncharacterized protein n=1 Tax=Pleurodeles waltl TaxID=8319 RepID=A0AAV7QZN1_PLEWA|nr:hypothetical protein NDU88_010723 [Pleurodeles waltl]